MKYKTTLCKNYSLNGDCPLKDKCLFAHGNHEIKKDEDFSTPFNNEGISKLIENKNSKNYKRQLCRHFELGRCNLGDICNFAHGSKELRNTDNNNNNIEINNLNKDLITDNSYKELNSFYNVSKASLIDLKNNILTELNLKNANNIDKILKNLYSNLDKYTLSIENMKSLLLNKKEINNEDLKVLRQLIFISENLEELYLDNELLIEKISNAKNLLEKRSIKESAEILQKILFNSELYQKNKIKHDNIIENARKVY